jgi:hypothetical protein
LEKNIIPGNSKYRNIILGSVYTARLGMISEEVPEGLMEEPKGFLMRGFGSGIHQ